MPDKRILTTHVGSLPRPQSVVDQVFAEDKGQPVDRAVFDRVIEEGVKNAVRHQVESRVDVVSDGEMSKIGYATYIRHRLTGFEIGEIPRATPADLDAFPNFRNREAEKGAHPKYLRPICRGPIRYEHWEPLEKDLAHLKKAIEGQPVAGAFMNAPSPGVIALFQPNEYYKTREEYLDALGEAMKPEYEAIVNAGILLQIDAPDLAMGRHIMYRNEPDDAFVKAVDIHVAAINRATRDIPPERMRVHICWGNYEGPHHFDIPVKKIIEGLLRLRPSHLLFEGANPRHEHEWEVWQTAKIPADKILVPGVVSSTTNYIEAPELIAQRLGHYIDIVGIDRVMAGTDCGFGTWAGFGKIDPDICWAKLRAMADGAALAANRRKAA